MMRLDLNVDLGLRILLLLTWHEDEGPLGTSAIAEAEGLVVIGGVEVSSAEGRVALEALPGLPRDHAL